MDYQRGHQHRGIDRSRAVEEKEMPRMMAFLQEQGFSQIVRTPENGVADFRALRKECLCFIEIRVRSPEAKSPDVFTIRQGKLKVLGRLSWMGDVYLLLVNSQHMELVSYDDIPRHTNIKIFDVEEDTEPAEDDDDGDAGSKMVGFAYPAEKRRRKQVRDALTVLSTRTELSSYRVMNHAVMFALRNKETFAQYVETTTRRRRPYSSTAKIDSAVM